MVGGLAEDQAEPATCRAARLRTPDKEGRVVFGFFRRKGKGGKGPDAPLSPFQHSRQLDQSIAEMLKVMRRVLADGVVTVEEAGALSAWTTGHPEVVEAWPGWVGVFVEVGDDVPAYVPTLMFGPLRANFMAGGMGVFFLPPGGESVENILRCGERHGVTEY